MAGLPISITISACSWGERGKNNIWVHWLSKGFHVDCFTAYHFQDALKGNAKALVDMITRGCDKENNARVKKRCKMIGSLDLLNLH